MIEHVKPSDSGTGVIWRKASASQSSQGCVEVAWVGDGRVALRDSKNRAKPALVVSAHAWAGLLYAAKHGDLDA